ncbi:MAG: hypothetical protein ACRC5A_16185 [Enterobacteriaceae bacterium]
MSILPNELCKLLGLDSTQEQPSLVIDDSTIIYFEAAEQNLEMVSPVASLPDNPAILKQLLYHNMAGDITLAADDELTLLLAIERLPLTECQQDIEENIKKLVTRVHKIRSKYEFSGKFSQLS